MNWLLESQFFFLVRIKLYQSNGQSGSLFLLNILPFFLLLLLLFLVRCHRHFFCCCLFLRHICLFNYWRKKMDFSENTRDLCSILAILQYLFFDLKIRPVREKKMWTHENPFFKHLDLNGMMRSFKSNVSHIKFKGWINSSITLAIQMRITSKFIQVVNF